MGIPYQEIGIGVAFILGVWAIITAESLKGRIFIGAIMAGIFVIPVVWRSKVAQLISFLAWIVFGISCYLFVKLRGIGAR
jgi:hypothetical protein